MIKQNGGLSNRAPPHKTKGSWQQLRRWETVSTSIWVDSLLDKVEVQSQRTFYVGQGVEHG